MHTRPHAHTRTQPGGLAVAAGQASQEMLERPLREARESLQKLDPQLIHAVSGALAGALTAVVVCPLDVLKTRLQVHHGKHHHNAGVAGERRSAHEGAGGCTACRWQRVAAGWWQGTCRNLS